MIAPRRLLTFACVIFASLAPLTTARQRAAGRGAQAPSAGRATQGSRPDASAEVHTLTFTVTDDKGNFLKGLRRERFSVFDGKSRREITSFGEVDAPASVGILLDTSGSMFSKDVKRPDRNTRLRLLRDALSLFLARSNPSNEYFLIAFNQGPQMFVEPTTDGAAVLSAFDRIAAANLKGQTAFYDALYLALAKSSLGKYPRRAILAVTDGMDNMSHYTFPEVKRALAESDVTLYVLAVMDEDDAALGQDADNILDELTSLSGGRALYPRDWSGAGEVAGYFARELRNLYSVSFVPAQASDRGGWHEVRIKMADLRDEHGKKVSVKLRARQGFYDVTSPPK
jgi:Ca-activated chloride channel family protein